MATIHSVHLYISLSIVACQYKPHKRHTFNLSTFSKFLSSRSSSVCVAFDGRWTVYIPQSAEETLLSKSYHAAVWPRGNVRNAEPDLLLAGPLFRKKCGSPYYMNTLPRLLSLDKHIIEILLRNRAFHSFIVFYSMSVKKNQLFTDLLYMKKLLLHLCTILFVQGGPKNVKYVTPSYDDAGRRSLYQPYEI